MLHSNFGRVPAKSTRIKTICKSMNQGLLLFVEYFNLPRYPPDLPAPFVRAYPSIVEQTP
jgi:hypothetical protein